MRGVGHGARGGEVAPPRGCSPRGRPASAQSEQRGGSGVSATTDCALGLSEERGVRGDGGRPGGEAGAGWGGGGRTHGPARLAGQTFVWRGEEADGSGSAGKVGSAERHRAHTHLPPSRACLDVPPALNSSTSALWPHCPSPGSRTRFTAGTAPINRERCKSIREEVRTGHSSPLARVPRRTEASGRRRGALQRPTPLAPAAPSPGAVTNPIHGRNCTD